MWTKLADLIGLLEQLDHKHALLTSEVKEGNANLLYYIYVYVWAVVGSVSALGVFFENIDPKYVPN